MCTKRIILFLVLFLAFSPGYSSAGDFPKTQGYVSDFAGVIDQVSRTQIEAVAREVEEKTGVEIAVVTLKTIGNDTIENTAVALFKEWGIGRKGKDNGLLLVASMNEKKVRLETGYGLEGILPDGKCGEIIDKYILPEFRTGKFGRGIAVGTFAAAIVIADDAGVKLSGVGASRNAQKEQARIPIIFRLLIFLGLAVLFIRHPFLFLLILSSGRGGGGGGGFGGGFGGFGGFGGGMSGGGGSSRGW